MFCFMSGVLIVYFTLLLHLRCEAAEDVHSSFYRRSRRREAGERVFFLFLSKTGFTCMTMIKETHFTSHGYYVPYIIEGSPTFDYRWTILHRGISYLEYLILQNTKYINACLSFSIFVLFFETDKKLLYPSYMNILNIPCKEHYIFNSVLSGQSITTKL